MILAIDPGCTESAYVILDENLKPIEFKKVLNQHLEAIIVGALYNKDFKYFAIEMVASYGMAVGKEVFDTVFWIGRFWEIVSHWSKGEVTKTMIYRKDEKINLCQSMKAKDGNIRQALIDRFGEVGVKKNPGWFYGVSKDVWSAIAVGVTYSDMYLKDKQQII